MLVRWPSFAMNLGAKQVESLAMLPGIEHVTGSRMGRPLGTSANHQRLALPGGH